MANQSIGLSNDLNQYLWDVSLRESEILGRLRNETSLDKSSGMQISPEAGQLLSWLVKLIGAKRTLEIGVFTGYTSLVVALALPADGQLIACDVDERWTAIARRYWEEAGVAHKISLKLAPAVETLQSLLDQDQANSFDFAFIDADKPNYETYL